MGQTISEDKNTIRSMPFAQLRRQLLRWLALCIVISVVVGSVVALFLWSLDQVTSLQWQNRWLIFSLPIAGILSGWLYYQWGGDCEAGSSLIYARIRQCNHLDANKVDERGDPPKNVPWHMAPLVLIGTLLTHLFGGSAGREGTAVQMGAALASGLANWLKLNPLETATLLQAGVAAGFGAVFGTPLASTVFALEVVGRGVSRVASLPACLFCAILADRVTAWWGIEHTPYQIAGPSIAMVELNTVLKVLVASAAFGVAARLFLESIHRLNRLSQKLIAVPWLRPAVGGTIVAAIVWCTGSQQYVGLGVVPSPVSPDDVCIVSSFANGGADRLSWLWKIVLTAITLGSGFKGGEATPLFFIGAALGNSLGGPLGLPIDLAAGLGFVALFAAATKTPLACTIMAVELFRQDATVTQTVYLAIYALVACQMATWLQLKQAAGTELPANTKTMINR